MSGQRSSNSEGTAESVAAGCSLREGPSKRSSSSSRTLPPLHSAGLAVFSWGRGEDGQLGLGDTADQDEPTYVDALRGVGVRQIACGSGHTVVLTTDGDVFTWGTYVACLLRYLQRCFGLQYLYLIKVFTNRLDEGFVCNVLTFSFFHVFGQVVEMMAGLGMGITAGSMFRVCVKP